MSKFFFKGRIEPREKYQRFGYNTKREMKLGTQSQPLSLKVCDEARKTAIEEILQQHGLVGNVDVNPAGEESLQELDAILNKPQTQLVEQKPQRNDPCSCGSGKKYKKCCGQ
jgi:SWIM/SEC-C metal-binding protein